MCFLAFLWKQRENFYLNTSNKKDGFSQHILPCGSNTVVLTGLNKEEILQCHPNNYSKRTLEIKRKTPQQNKIRRLTLKI